VTHLYKVRRPRDKRGVDLISDALPFGRLWYAEPNAVANAIGYAQHRSRSHCAVTNRPFQFQKRSGFLIRTHDEALAVEMRVNNPDRSPFGVNG
jgi:hypothetical protein